jgi:hypothetical protein
MLNDPAPAKRPMDGSAMLMRDRAAGNDALALALFWQKADAGGNRGPGIGELEAACRRFDAAFDRRVAPESSRNFGAARADEAGNAEHFALMQVNETSRTC